MGGQRKALKLTRESVRELAAATPKYTNLVCNKDSNVYCSEAVLPDDNGPGWVARRKNTRATKPAGSATC